MTWIRTPARWKDRAASPVTAAAVEAPSTAAGSATRGMVSSRFPMADALGLRRRPRGLGFERPAAAGVCGSGLTSRTAARNALASGSAAAAAVSMLLRLGERCLAMNSGLDRLSGFPGLQYSPHGDTRQLEAGC